MTGRHRAQRDTVRMILFCLLVALSFLTICVFTTMLST